MSYQPIENYGVIGDLHTVALVGLNGSIDMMSFPNFDSPTIFAALLDDARGGRFKIAPIFENGRHRQLYLTDTNVLLTRFLSSDGMAEISDFMPLKEMGHSHDVVRRVKALRGEIRFRVLCQPRFDYARAAHRVEQEGCDTVFIPDRQHIPALRLRSSVPLRIENGAATAEFTLGHEETASFVLEEAVPGQAPACAAHDYVSHSFKETVNFWRRWIGRSTYRGRWREMVNRSALVLKLLTSRPDGSVIAAPTFGLPEDPGGVRNWDYRYTWIRDASFTIYAFMRLGFTDEARDFMRWIEARCAELEPDGSLQVLYGRDGRHDLSEQQLDHFDGYLGSKPVCVGNEAYRQFQLDIYGALMDAIYLYNKYGELISYDLWRNVVRLVDWVCSNWEREDEGIWEFRSGCHEFLYSRVGCWVAVDRAIRLALKRSFPAPLEQWQKTRDAIYHDVFRHYWRPSCEAFVQYKGGKTLDAAALLMPLLKFVSPTDPRWLATLRGIGDRLCDDALVHRYNTDEGRNIDGLRGKEGTFAACSFWYAECLARSGDLDQARFFFDKVLGYANHVGLYAEEIGPCGQHLGNFPQALTHLALISAAYDLDRRLSAAGWQD